MNKILSFADQINFHGHDFCNDNYVTVSFKNICSKEISLWWLTLFLWNDKIE